MAKLAAWAKKHSLVVTGDMPPFFWMKGYFFAREKGPNGEAILNQNLHEVLIREYFFQAFGDIVGKHVLDIGCGFGDYMAVAAEMGASVSGIDPFPPAIEGARKLHATLGLATQFQVADASTLPFEDNAFDVVYSADVFEHIDLATKQAAVKEIYRVLKPGGRVVIKTPNLDYLRITVNLHRLCNLLKLKSPRIYIEHTRNNPDNEHHGLTTYRALDRVFAEQLFLESEITHVPFRRGPFFLSAKCRFPGRSLFNETIVVTYKKSMFLPIAERLAKRIAA